MQMTSSYPFLEELLRKENPEMTIYTTGAENNSLNFNIGDNNYSLPLNESHKIEQDTQYIIGILGKKPLLDTGKKGKIVLSIAYEDPNQLRLDGDGTVFLYSPKELDLDTLPEKGSLEDSILSFVQNIFVKSKEYENKTPLEKLPIYY